MAAEILRVLDVGNCDPDHAAIRGMILKHFDVELDRVMFVGEALEAMKRRRYALVLVNRLIFDDGSPGIELLNSTRKEAAFQSVPIMLLSNYPEAQQAAIQAGAVPGFGKAQIGLPTTIELLSSHIPRKTVR